MHFLYQDLSDLKKKKKAIQLAALNVALSWYETNNFNEKRMFQGETVKAFKTQNSTKVIAVCLSYLLYNVTK